jgi:cytidylate kinase
VNPNVVAVDGPGGSGKSTVSRRVAERLGWRHLDTGAFYRAATVVVLEAGADPGDPGAVMAAVAGRRFEQQGGVTTIDGLDVSGAIRSQDVNAAVSAVSAHPDLRRMMVAAQRAWVAGLGSGAVVEGRDIGTVVFPDARVKIFLTADPAERARRRAVEMEGPTEEVATHLQLRDRLDSTRAVSPLKPAGDAVAIDTTGLGIEEVVDRVVQRARAVYDP